MLKKIPSFLDTLFLKLEKMQIEFNYTGSDAGAIFSECRKYRYVLWRAWEFEKPFLMFIGLNPSTANENKNDATIRRVISMAKWMDYGGVFMLNCFSFISTDPNKLYDFGNTKENDEYINYCAGLSKDIIFSWGAFKQAHFRQKELSQRFPTAKALKINKDGSPAHPLYIPTHTIPILFNSK